MKKLIFGVFLLFGVIWASQQIQWKSDLIFSHKFHHDEVEADCAVCHKSALTSEQGTDDLLPAMETCYSCHDQDDTECSVCHKTPDEPLVLPRITDYSKKFNHKLHTEKGIACLTCHVGINGARGVEGSLHLPKMARCMDCHKTPQDREGCYLCHERNESLLPTSHLTDWQHRHGAVSEAEGRQNCRSCHQEDDCVQCHQGENLDNQTHPAQFIATHSLSYLTRESNCFACHEGKTYCRECHMDVEHVVPMNHTLANWPAEGHAQAARTDYDNCTVCHQSDDPICSQCHN